ncbi:non-SMC mitotic condensation complex subunit 1 [Nitzschia inconspicua]|uniref:Non-SMC mitotic condensation complex subunit 1 n=1 Tax=Nitzschia inconspicua TaxID=303405 RepID=A0A9K3KWV7_9STRA|nr:non-SMC mitotic condensation complex subunit 1 [Nitzschia inconspicua]
MTTALPILQETFQSLLDSSPENQELDMQLYNESFVYNDACGDLEERQGQLCHRLYQQLQQELQYHRKHAHSRSQNDAVEAENIDPNHTTESKSIDKCESTTTTSSIRTLFPDQRVSDLLELVVTPLLNARVETQQLLPATQDVDANEEVLDNKAALSLTLPSLQAGRLYAHLLSRPGALGSGLVELGPLTALVALIRRWNLECCGREKDALSTKEPQHMAAGSLYEGESPSKSPPKKRWRANTTDSAEDDSEETKDDDVTSDSKDENVLSLGSLVALEVSKIAQQQEFASWSSESQEILLDAIVSAMGTAAALVASKGGDAAGTFTAQCILEQGQKSLVQCIAGKSLEENENQFQQQRQESAIAVLRGLMHLLQQKVILPNGERGMQHSHDMAGQVVALLMKKIWERANADTRSSIVSKTPSQKGRRRSNVGSLVKTPRSASARGRLSLDGLTIMTSPVLKKKHTRTSGVGTMATDKRKPRGIQALFVGLLQKLATGRSGLEKATLRKSTVKMILSCLAWMSHTDRTYFLKYLLKICHSKVSVHRLVACELLGEVLSQHWLDEHMHDYLEDEDDYDDHDDEHQSPTSCNNSQTTLPQALWRGLRGRLVDRISSVRAAAAASLECAASAAQGTGNDNKTALNDEDVEQLLVALTRRAMKDDTATVRKTSVVAMSKLLRIYKQNISDFHLAAICDLCQDASLLTRRAAADSLTILLHVFTNSPSDPYFVGLIEEAWSSNVLPMVLDEETSVKAVELFHQIVLTPILDDTHGSLNQQEAAWRVLSSIGNMSGQHGASKGATRALQKALSQIMRENPNLINSKLLREVASVANETLEHDSVPESKVVGVWCLIDSLLSVDGVNPKQKSMKFEFCARGWEVMLQRHLNAPKTTWLRTTLKFSLSLLSKSARSMDSLEAEKCHATLLEHVISFSLPPDSLGSAIAALRELSFVHGTQDDMKFWVGKVFDRCEEEMSDFLLSLNGDSGIPISRVIQSREPALLRALFTAGELSVIGFNPEEEKQSSPSFVHIPPSKRLQELIQIMVSDSLPCKGEVKTPTCIRAHAFTVLGKFCLTNETLARKSLTLLARELHPTLTNTEPAVQSNALLVLGDLCVRYTNMSDRYLPVMASCLQNGTGTSESLLLMDQAAVVRKHAVLLLSSLLLQDYIKWRGLLFHRFLVACSDDDVEVASLAETVLSGPLWVRNPKLFFNHFVESIFVLNRCTAHPIYIAAANQGDGGSGIAVGFEGINLNGPGGESKRRQMYDFLLSKLSDEEKIGVTARLAKEVLGGAIESTGDLSKACQGPPPNNGFGSPRWESAWNVLTDSFYVLTHKAIKVKKIQEDTEAVALEDPNLPNSPRHVIAAKNRLLSKISLKHMMEIVLPILCNLKVKLQASNSPLLKDLMVYFLEIFRTYKTEVKEFLANDPQLLQEIEFDARHQGVRPSL